MVSEVDRSARPSCLLEEEVELAGELAQIPQRLLHLPRVLRCLVSY